MIDIPAPSTPTTSTWGIASHQITNQADSDGEVKPYVVQPVREGFKVPVFGFKSVLYLDDVRVPLDRWVDHVRNYDEFVDYLQTHAMPEVISWDHDIAEEHYPTPTEGDLDVIPYETYIEKTGLDCARYVVENSLPLNFWSIHSLNPVGGENIRRLLRAYRPEGELGDLYIPHRMEEQETYGCRLGGGWRL